MLCCVVFGCAVFIVLPHGVGVVAAIVINCACAHVFLLCCIVLHSILKSCVVQFVVALAIIYNLAFFKAS